MKRVAIKIKNELETLIRKPFPSLEAKQYQVLIHTFRPLFIMLYLLCFIYYAEIHICILK